MKKYFLGILTFLSITLFASISNAGVGVSLIIGEAETSGTETEKTVTGVTSETNSITINEAFYGGSIFAEFEIMGGRIGLDWVPVDVTLGARSRDDTGGTDDGVDTGARKAEAELSDLFTLYVNVPFGPGYVLLGAHQVDVNTIETLPTSSYGNETIQGYQLGYGFTNGTASIEAFYSDFEDISITGTGSAPAQNKIDADADTMGLKLKIAFGGF